MLICRADWPLLTAGFGFYSSWMFTAFQRRIGGVCVRLNCTGRPISELALLAGLIFCSLLTYFCRIDCESTHMNWGRRRSTICICISTCSRNCSCFCLTDRYFFSVSTLNKKYQAKCRSQCKSITLLNQIHIYTCSFWLHARLTGIDKSSDFTTLKLHLRWMSLTDHCFVIGQ